MRDSGAVGRFLRDRADPVRYLSQRKIAQRDRRGFVTETRPWVLDPYQEKFVRSQATERVVLKARQCGGSQMIAGEALWLMKHYERSDLLAVSDTQAHAQNIVRMVLDLSRSDPEIKWVGKPTDTSLRLRMQGTRSTLRSLSSSSSSSRSFTAQRVYLDEFAFARGAGEIIVAARGTLALGGQLTVVSTPHLRSGPFFELYQEAAAGEGPELHTIHWSQCPRYNPEGWWIAEAAERIAVGQKGAWYRRERARFGKDAAKWRREYECDFESGGGRVFPGFSRAVHVIPGFKVPPDWLRIRGIDPGIRMTAAVWLAVNGDGELFAYQEYGAADTPVSVKARAILAVGPATYTVIDPQAYARSENDGEQLIGEWIRHGVYASGRRTSRDAGIERIRELLGISPETGRPGLRVCDSCPNLIRELENYTYRHDQATQPHKRDDHFVDALRYALFTTPAPMPPEEREPKEYGADGRLRVERLIWEEEQSLVRERQEQDIASNLF